MSNDELTRILLDRAAEAPAPHPDLLAWIEHRVARDRHRRLAAAGIAVVAALGLVGGAGSALVSAHDERPATIVGVPSTAPTPPSLSTAPSTAPSAATAQVVPAPGVGTGTVHGPSVGEVSRTDGLTGSFCDDPGAQRPLDYLSWPCVTPAPALAANLRSLAVGTLDSGYVGIVAPRLRVIADAPDAPLGSAGAYPVPSAARPAPRTDARLLTELWDAAHPETPAILISSDAAGASFLPAPAGDPAILVAQGLVAARSPVTRVRFAPGGQTVALSHGIGTAPTVSPGATLTGLDAGGRTRQTVTYRAQAIAPAPVCQAPGRTAPPRYLDWPCARPAGTATAHRVARAVAQVLARNRGIRDLRIRLLADGDGVTLVELWDAAGSGPVLLQGVRDDTKLAGGLADIGTGDVPLGDPSIVRVGLDQAGDFLAFTRAGITMLTLDTGTARTPVPSTNGVAPVPVVGVHDTAHWTLVGSDAAGRVVETVAWVRYDKPCATVSSTCVPIG